MTTAATALAIAASYLVGAIPTSLLVGRLVAGIDLREHGSRNLGATNLFRCLGWKYALPVGLFDIAKGTIPVVLFAPMVRDGVLMAVLCGVAAIVGHVFSVFVRFKGGKGVATAAGVVLGLTPIALGIAFLVWAALVWLTGYVSVGSIVAALFLPLAAYLLSPEDPTLAAVYAVLATFIVWAHRANIRRLLSGTESRFGRRAAPGSAA